MSWDPGRVSPGHHITYIECRKCGHLWSGAKPDNWIVGKTHRLICSKCGSRDAAVSLSWVWTNCPDDHTV